MTSQIVGKHCAILKKEVTQNKTQGKAHTQLRT